MKPIIIIPARRNSKRLKGKNVKLLEGTPLIEYSIEYAKDNYDLVNDIIISSDDERIEKIANKHEVKFFKRPDILADDLTPTSEVLKHVLKQYHKSCNYVILLQPTNPLRPKSLLKEALQIVKEKNLDSLMTVTRNSHKLGEIKKNKFIPFNYKYGQRSQDITPLYYENGLLYITKSELIFNNVIISDDVYPLVVEHPFGKIDIDTQEDFNLAEFFLKK